MATYVFDQGWQEERRRLAGIEALWDEGTRVVMERLGVSHGWRCVEVGAGGGSMVEWIAERVGASGHVLATDVDTRFLEAIERPNVEVRRLDVLREELPAADFDLVYSRLVVEHLGLEALTRMIPAARPGGIVLLEDYDWGSAAVHPADARFDRVNGAVLEFMSRAGFDPNFGRRIVAELRTAGLEDVDGTGRVRLIRGGTPETDFYRLSLAAVGGAVVEAGLLTREDVDEALGALDDPGATYLSPIVVSAWGRVPVA